jgi:SAM-dependent methyltransferase
MSTAAASPTWVRQYEQSLPGFAEQLRRTIHVPPSHPMYQTYYEYAFWRFEQGAQLAALLGRMRPLGGATVLDIGSGAGGVSARLAQAGARVIGLDVAWGFLRLARAAYRDLGVRVLSLFASGERIPLRSASCDLVLAMDILEHVPDPKALLDEIARCLKPSGLVCLQTGYRYDWKNIRRDPHYGLPLVVLLPRWLRELVVVRLTRRNPELEDHYWFKSYREVWNSFAARGIVLHHEADLLVGGRLDAAEVVLGTPEDRLHIDGNPGRRAGFYAPERHDGLPMRWTRRRAIIYLRRGPGRHELHLRLAALDPRIASRPQTVCVRVDGGWPRKVRLADHRWFDWTVPVRNSGNETQEICIVELAVSPTWSPTELGIEDGRELGVAVHSAALRELR